MTPAILIEKYLRLRNKKDEVKARHERELEPYVTVMKSIELELLKHLDNTKLDSIKSSHGTAYKAVATSVTVSDWKEVLDYIKQHEAWDMLEARVAKNATLAMIEDTEKPVPGVKISQAIVLRVRTGQG